MLLDESPVFTPWVHHTNIASIDCPQHWNVIENNDPSLLLRFHPPDSQRCLLTLGISSIPMMVPDSHDLPTIQSRLRLMLSTFKVDRYLGPSNLLCYPSQSARLVNGTCIYSAIHHDLMILIHTQYPAKRTHIYQPIFERMISSFRIDRSRRGRSAILRTEVVHEFRKQAPHLSCTVSGEAIQFGQFQVFVDNLLSEIDSAPDKRKEIIDLFVQRTLKFNTNASTVGHERWDQVKHSIFPMVRPDSIIRAAQQASGLHTTPADTRQQLVAAPWLANLVTCYAIDTPDTLRFILHADLQRWGISQADLHQQAITNLGQASVHEMTGVRTADGSFTLGSPANTPGTVRSAWILHPNLHQILSPHFRGRIWAGIPNRDTFMLFAASDHKRNQILRPLREDFTAGPHSISDRLFEITPDGIALA